MKVPVSWLQEYVDLDATPQELADKLTFSGIEVEGIATIGSDYAGVVVGEVRHMEPHPGADRLRLCRVFNGTEELQVVCGATNFEVGDKAPFAGVGVTLPGDFKIKKAKIRGEKSFGMLCAEDELELSDDHDGIMILPHDSIPGTPLSDILGPPDTVLELEITWNRPDCLSIIGIAREFAALYGTSLKIPEISLNEGTAPISDFVSVTIDDAAGCPRYTARALTDIKIGPSPLWMQRRLSMCGVRPINNIVDVTNYVMLECGHPLHAFDHALLSENQIVVRTAASGEKMATLDGVERPLTSDMLLIADSEKPVAIAGVMGAAGSEIQADTETVLLESACFDPRRIRRTSSTLSLSTESSHRFERGVNVETVDWASNRAAQLMQSLAGGFVATGILDVYPGKREPRQIKLELARMDRLLGVSAGVDRVVAIFESLMIPVVEKSPETVTVEVPAFRLDLDIEADLVEEVARMYGLAHVPDIIPQAKVVPNACDEPSRAIFSCRDKLIGLGLHEIMSYSFVSESLLNIFTEEDQAARVLLPNPVSADHGVMRNSLIPQMVECLGRNHSRQITDAALFEIGKVFWKDSEGAVNEEDRVCIGLMGKVGCGELEKRRTVKPDEVFLWAKGVVEALVSAQRLDKDTLRFTPAEHPYSEPGEAVTVKLGDTPLGVLGLLRKDLRHRHRMADPVAFAELPVTPLLGSVFTNPVFHPIPQYPAISRDVAIAVDQNVSHSAILKVIHEAAPVELTGIDLFDIFTGEGVKRGTKSLGYSLTYRSFERTLTDEDANGYHEAIKDALKRELDVDIREG
ncbi:MAG: phenylalanine--tRNA ligase subunit beta [Verrucomicrobia bacterium]|jgi:phenylalanyl-tRNA synthetase beta chain|nr:phenylalanine--tRNA ligase subunit beta [Verrucomicrobiota bacterium]